MSVSVRCVALLLLASCVSLSNVRALPETAPDPQLLKEASRRMGELAAEWPAEDAVVAEAEVQRLGRLGEILRPESSVLSESQDFALTQ